MLLSSKMLARTAKQCLQYKYMSTGQGVPEFEKVFSLPFIKYLALFNRLKVYHIAGSSVAVPSSGVLEMCNILSENSLISTSIIAITGAAVLSAASLPFRNIIGLLYISEDNKFIKISSVDYWGKRVDKTIPTEEWIPILSLEPRPTDGIYLTPKLSDNTTYKWFIKFGNVHNSQKIGQVLE